MTLFEKHQVIIEQAIQAIHQRGFWAAYPEHPKAYGETAIPDGEAAFKNMLNKKFESLNQPGATSWGGEEVSPYTQEKIGVSYPLFSAQQIIARAAVAQKQFRNTSAEERAGILVECLEAIKQKFFEIAYATMHTTGQSFMMSFQASGPHSNDRALEPIALGYEELKRFPSNVMWEKPMGKISVKLDKNFTAVPKGIGLVIGCSTFPVWNTVPGLFADLITGNVCIVKPHPMAVLPIAMVIAEMRKIFSENGLNPDCVQLAADTSSHLITKELAEDPSVKLIDYTGSSTFGNYIESIPNKISFTEKAGVNSVIIDSVNDIDAVMGNLAFSVSLYSGQMCTAPQNFFIPAKIATANGELTFEEVVAKLEQHISAIANNPKMGPGTLGAIQNPATLHRVQSIDKNGKVVLPSSAVKNEEFVAARTASPALMEALSSDKTLFEKELFGPIAIAIKCADTKEAVALAKEMAVTHGAITCAAYTTSDDMMKFISAEMNEVFTPVSFNLTGFIWVNQHAAFSDFHVTGGNAAGNASFTNPEYLVKRFVLVGNRKMV